MKGQDERFWVYTNLAIVLIVIAALISPLFRSIELAQANNAGLQAQEIAGVINMMAASPAVSMEYRKGLPRACSILVTNSMVRVVIDPESGNPSMGTANLIQSPVAVASAEMRCTRDKRKIDIVKTGSRIEVR